MKEKKEETDRIRKREKIHERKYFNTFFKNPLVIKKQNPMHF